MTVKELKKILSEVPVDDTEIIIQTGAVLPHEILGVSVEHYYYSPTKKFYAVKIFTETK